MVKNSLNIAITRPSQELIIMRGIPGSGKSTAAKKLVSNGVIHSTDTLIEKSGNYSNFFKRMIESGDWTALIKMHNQNYLNAEESMMKGISPVIIDNTNIKKFESQKYIKRALELGYSDDNIRFVDIGTNGLSAEELAKRNTHNVGLDTIKRMISSYKSVGPLTIRNIMEGKGKNTQKKKRIKFASLVLDNKSKEKLLGAVGHLIPDGWKIFAHHMTINYGSGLPEHLVSDLGEIKTIRATAIGMSDVAMAVMVDGYSSSNKTPHVTIAINVQKGGKPVQSNDINHWTRLDNYINLSGEVVEQIF